MKKTTFKRLAAGFAASVLMLTSLTGCGASKSLDNDIEYASEKVDAFSHFKVRSSGVFSESVFSKANTAAMMMNDDSTDEDYAKIARYLSLDSITVVSDERKVVASYPEDENGKALKELEDRKSFISIVKNSAVKQMTDPVRTEDGRYSLFAGVKRADGTGVVIIGLTTDDYADVTGENLAESCGNNTIILQDGSVISSTLEGVGYGDTAEKLGIKDEGSFSLTAGDKKYQCKADTVAEYTVVCGEPA